MILKLYEKNNNPQDLQRIVDLLKDGGLIIYPTDTMYAIGCHGLKERAIERICRIKEIDPKKNNLSIICYDLRIIIFFVKFEYHNCLLFMRITSLTPDSRYFIFFLRKSSAFSTAFSFSSASALAMG